MTQFQADSAAERDAQQVHIPWLELPVWPCTLGAVEQYRHWHSEWQHAMV